MSKVESPERFAVRVAAARVRMKIDRMRNEPSPDWIIALVDEGDRRERAQRESASGTP